MYPKLNAHAWTLLTNIQKKYKISTILIKFFNSNKLDFIKAGIENKILKPMLLYTSLIKFPFIKQVKQAIYINK